VRTVDLPRGLRLRHTASHCFAFNYWPEETEWNGEVIPAGGVTWWPVTH